MKRAFKLAVIGLFTLATLGGSVLWLRADGAAYLSRILKTASPQINLPPDGFLYHGVYPGGITGEEDDLTLKDVRAYEQAAGKPVAWVYFSHNWYHGRDFPITTTTWIRQAGSVPYLRLMLRSDAEQAHAEPTFTLTRIIRGDFDADLRAWARAAQQFGSPLIAEYGTEMNGKWFPWNGVWNGGGVLDGYGDPAIPDGPERFRDAYRHIIQISREERATNLTWVFHVNGNDVPADSWNRFENYYPGDEWIDWLGVSVYGAQTPLESEWPQFRADMDQVYPRLSTLSAQKPLILAEFGITSGNPHGHQADWAEAALTDLTGSRWPRLMGFSWWNETWQNDDDPAHDTDMRVQANPDLAGVFQNLVGAQAKVLGRPVGDVWQPALNTSWQWQLSGPLDPTVNATMYDVDLFETTAEQVADLHAQGRRVVCYISVGSWEEWRPDASQFPAEVIGNDYEGWPGEKWLDIRRIDLLEPIMRQRLDMCQAKGFEAVEPDNIDGYINHTGFPLTYQNQLTYNVWLANEAHARGLSIGLKNDPDQVADLLPYFDFALTEDCFDQQWCHQVEPFITAGKAVFAAEYTDTGMTTAQFCPQANAMNFNAMLKKRDLDAWREACR